MPKRVLLIDYEAHSIERARGVLRAPEYEVVPAHDGEEALNTFSASRFDLVLLSGMLPRLPSAEVIREIRRRGGHTAPPILLMVSGYKGHNPKADAQRVGAFDLLPRPFSDEALSEAVARAIAANEAAAKAAAPSNRAAGSLTSSDIFSDILEEVAKEAREGSASAPASAAADTEAEVERRLRDTLSGVLPKSPAPAAPPKRQPSASDQADRLRDTLSGVLPKTPATPVRRASSTSEDVDKLISQTLSGIRTQPRPRPPSPAGPAPEAPQAAPAPRPPDRFGKYEILERISSGGMAELFRARLSGAEGFQKIVAIKKILPHIAGDEEVLTMFADEAKLAAQLSHPNIVHIFDLGKIESGGYFIAMEHVEGKDLRAILHLARETGLAIPIPLAVSIGSKVAAALDYAHRRLGDDEKHLHIVHRDVSPPNILVSTNGDVKLCDFGIAKAASKVSRTESGALKGKVPYMSPEQAWGKPVDQSSDIYSLGSVLFEMLTGRKLFTGDSDLSVLEKVRAGDVIAPSSLNREVPPALDAAVLRCLAREPDRRYPNASDLLKDLEALLRTYEPPPSSADLAVYVRHLEAEDAARREARARDAAASPPATKTPLPRREVRVPLPQEPPKPKPAPPAPPPPPPGAPAEPDAAAAAAGIFAASYPEAAEAEGRRRAKLYGMIAAAALLLVVAVFLVARKPAPKPAAAQAAPVASPPAAVASLITPVPTAPAAPVLDQKAIQEEAQRQLAARRKEMQKTPAAAAPASRRPVTEVPSPVPVAPTAPPPAPTPEVKVAEVQPTAAPAAEPPPTAAPTQVARAEAPEVARGDLVGPGPGVVEPALVSAPRVSYPPAVRQQVVPGKVVVLVLVDEDGAVSNVRLQQGVVSKLVNEAVLEAVRAAKFRPATKNGVPVKMWRTVVVDVRP
jgi:TonB family protein